MNRISQLKFVIGVAAFFVSPLCFSQEDSPLRDIIDEIVISGLSNENTTDRTSATIDVLRQSLESPETQSKILNSYLQSDSGWQFLKDINFKFKAFDADARSETALGFSYDYQKSLTDHPLPCGSEKSACIRGLDLSISAKGNVAFDSDKNPNDFLDTSLDFGFFRSTGGSLGEPVDLLAMDQAFADAKTPEEEEAVIQKIIAAVRPKLTDQFYIEVAGSASLESNQQFTIKQWTYGFHTILEMKSWSTNSALSKFNVFDYPFALLRTLTGYEDCGGGSGKCFVPRGTSWPTFLLGITRVMPKDNDPRTLAGDSSDFDRVQGELSFKTPLARVGEDSLYISINYRYYKELGAASGVKAADLDDFDFVTVVLGGDTGAFVSYTNGKLPLDAVDDRVFELGYQFHF